MRSPTTPLFVLVTVLEELLSNTDELVHGALYLAAECLK
jgi:hypothetical protein